MLITYRPYFGLRLWRLPDGAGHRLLRRWWYQSHSDNRSHTALAKSYIAHARNADGLEVREGRHPFAYLPVPVKAYG